MVTHAPDITDSLSNEVFIDPWVKLLREKIHPVIPIWVYVAGIFKGFNGFIAMVFGLLFHRVKRFISFSLLWYP